MSKSPPSSTSTSLNAFINFRGQSFVEDSDDAEEASKLLTQFTGTGFTQLWSDSTKVVGTCSEGADGFVEAKFPNGEIFNSSIPNACLKEDGTIQPVSLTAPKSKPKRKAKAKAKTKAKGKAKTKAKPSVDADACEEREGSDQDSQACEEVEEDEVEEECEVEKEGDPDEGKTPPTKKRPSKKTLPLPSKKTGWWAHKENRGQNCQRSQ